MFQINELREEMRILAKESEIFARSASPPIIAPEHLLRCLVAADPGILVRTHEQLGGKIEFEINADKVLSRLAMASISETSSSAAHYVVNLSEASERVLHDAEVISLLKGRRRPSRDDAMLAIILNSAILGDPRLDTAALALEIIDAPMDMSAASTPGENAPVLMPVPPSMRTRSPLSGKGPAWIGEMKTMARSKESMEAVANQASSWDAALYSLNSTYMKPIYNYIKNKFFVNMAANDHYDATHAGHDAAAEFLARKLSDGRLYKKFIHFSKNRSEASFRAYIIESANNFVVDLLKKKNRERQMFIPCADEEDAGNHSTSRQSSPVSEIRRIEKASVVSTAIQSFIDELLRSPSKIVNNSIESNKLYFYIIYERLVSPCYYMSKEPTFMETAQKLSLITGAEWTWTQISNREITALAKLRERIEKAIEA